MRRLLLCALLLGGAACRVEPDAPSTVVVQRGELVIDVDVAGTLESVTSLNVGGPALPGVWNYKIAMMAPEGEPVAEGDPILVFDTTDLQRRLEGKVAERDSAATQLLMKRAGVKVARADEKLALAEAKAELRKAKLKAEVPPELLSTLELDQSQLDLRLAREKVSYLQAKAESAVKRDQSDLEFYESKRDRAQQRVEEITDAIDKMTVKAVRAGTIVYSTNWEGEKKKVGDSAWRQESILQIVSLAEMEGKGEVDEVDVSRVAQGQAVKLRLDAQTDVELRGTVKTISRTVQRTSPDNPLKVAVLQIELDPNEAVKLRPGMRFRGRIETDREQDVLLVPLEALRHTEGGPVAHRRVASGIEEVPVELGRRNDKLAVVVAGLDEGDEIVSLTEDAT